MNSQAEAQDGKGITPIVYGVDIGVYHQTRLGKPRLTTKAAWARVPCPTGSLPDLTFHPTNELHSSSGCAAALGRSFPELARLLVADLEANATVAFAFEAPMWFPIRRELPNSDDSFFEARFPDEKASEWYLQSGAAAALKAIGLGVWLFSMIHAKRPEQTFTFDVASWRGNWTDLLLAESFVTGDFKYRRRRRALRCPPDEWDAFLGAAALRAVELAEPVGATAVRLHAYSGPVSNILSLWQLILERAGFGTNGELASACSTYGVKEHRGVVPADGLVAR